MKKIAILGATGSIGTQTLDIVRAQKDLQVTAMAAGRNIDLFETQIREGTAGGAAGNFSHQFRDGKGTSALYLRRH